MSEISFEVGTANDVVDRLRGSTKAERNGAFIATARPQDLILLANFEDEVVGYLAASNEPTGLVVWEHVVVPDFQSRGVGRRLLLEAARRTSPMTRITIDPTGDFAIDLVAAYYSRLGFPTAPDDQFTISVRAHEVVDAVEEQLEEDATVETILRRKKIDTVITIAPDALITEALTLLNDRHIGSVVVSTDGSTIDGILSERDIVTGLHESGANLLDAKVRDHMTADVVTIKASDIIARVMEVATARRVRHLPVTDEGRLVGVVSVGDLLVFRMHEHDMRRDRLPYRDI